MSTDTRKIPLSQPLEKGVINFLMPSSILALQYIISCYVNQGHAVCHLVENKGNGRNS